MEKRVKDGQDHNLLFTGSSTIDGKVFFSHSPFRSGYFLAATGACTIAVLLNGFTLYRYWQRLSPNKASILCLVEWGVIITWWRGFRHLERIRELYLQGQITDAEPGSPINIVLGTVAVATSEMLFFSFSTMWLVQAYLIKLLSEAGR